MRKNLKYYLILNIILWKAKIEAIRLEVKTDPQALQRQALWCGVKPGMRVLDAGCGAGKQRH